MIVCAPEASAPCTALSPTPPQPITATWLPGWICAVFVTAPKPVITPQASSDAASKAISFGIIATWLLSTTTFSAKAPVRSPCHQRLAALARHRRLPVEREHFLAQHLVPAGAVVAGSARADQRHHHMVARFDAGDALADLFDDARRLVAEHHRQRRRPSRPRHR